MKNKILCIQISNNLINGKYDKNDISQVYYKTLYDIKKNQGYIKPKHFWELPLWVTEVDYNVDVDFYICKNITDTINYILNSNYHYILFSVLDVNKKIILKIMHKVKQEYKQIDNYNTIFILGGYININEYFKFYIHNGYALTFNTIKDFIEFLGLKYKKGNSYKLFEGYKTIPRLTLSTGCLNNCDFCTIEKKITPTSTQVIKQQIAAFKPLKFKLIYINDKTFGQCYNYKLLPVLYKIIKKYNSSFEGFIIQTTTGQILKISDNFIKESHIKYIELGIETFNDNILRKHNKPSSEKLTVRALSKINKLENAQAIVNIIIGLPEETNITYSNTLNLIKLFKKTISHLNIYNLAIYDNTELSKKIKYTESDKNELGLNKSFHKDINSHKNFYNNIHKLGINLLKEKRIINPIVLKTVLKSINEG